MFFLLKSRGLGIKCQSRKVLLQTYSYRLITIVFLILNFVVTGLANADTNEVKFKKNGTFIATCRCVIANPSATVCALTNIRKAKNEVIHKWLINGKMRAGVTVDISQVCYISREKFDNLADVGCCDVGNYSESKKWIYGEIKSQTSESE